MYDGIPREKVLARREAKRRHLNELEALQWDAPLCKEAWNHWVPGGEEIADSLEPRGTAKPGTERWTDPPEWIVDPSKPLTHHPVTGKKLAICPNVGAPTANECAAIPGGMRRKTLNRKYRAMAWNDAVQHGMIVEK